MERQTSGVWRSGNAAEPAGPEHRRRLSAGMLPEQREEVGRVCGWEQEPGEQQMEALFLALPDFPCCSKKAVWQLRPASGLPPALHQEWAQTWGLAGHG